MEAKMMKIKTRWLTGVFIASSMISASAQSGAPGSTGTGVTANVSPQTHCIDPTTGAPRLRTGSGPAFFSPDDMGNTVRSLNPGPTSGGAGMTVTGAGAPNSAGVGTAATGLGTRGSAGVSGAGAGAPATGSGPAGVAGGAPLTGPGQSSGRLSAGAPVPAGGGIAPARGSGTSGSAGFNAVNVNPTAPDAAGAGHPSRTPQ